MAGCPHLPLDEDTPIMSRISFTSHPFLLGFEQLDQLVEKTARTGSDGYPPYNIEQCDEDRYRITLAVAGFAETDLSITLEGGHLIVRGHQEASTQPQQFLHQGIAARQFQRSFVLAERMEVAEASLDHGLLHIDLFRKQADPAVQTIKIGR